MNLRRFACFTACLALAACATVPTATTDPAPAAPGVTAAPDAKRLDAIATAATTLDKDRLAILGMLGDFEVSFAFQETVILASDYQRKTSKTTDALETVVLVEDSPTRIVLQHLLVSRDGDHVIKHWRQDWHFEARERLEFSEDQVWRLRPLDASMTRGAWTQCVYEVSDAPRYCGTGKWTHRYGVATWTSDRTWRPLPRREYTTRKDYNALNAENRHTLTPGGWTHEQDNTKTVRIGEKTARTLVREFGFNDYRRITGFDFSPANAYWGATKGYWASVRAGWDSQVLQGRGLRLKYPVEGTQMIDAAFDQAERVEKGEAVTAAEIAALFEQWVAPPDAAVAAGGATP